MKLPPATSRVHWRKARVIGLLSSRLLLLKLWSPLKEVALVDVSNPAGFRTLKAAALGQDERNLGLLNIFPGSLVTHLLVTRAPILCQVLHKL